MLVAGVKLADGSFIRSINKISETLDKALFNVLEELGEPDYTPINVSATYYASTHFNPLGMGILYNITNVFMNAIVKKDIYPEGEWLNCIVDFNFENLNVHMDSSRIISCKYFL